MTTKEIESCRKGRKVQILFILEKTNRMRAKELAEEMNISGSNLRQYTQRLKDNGLIDMYDETRFKRPEDANYRFLYHSITDDGRRFIDELGKL